MLEKEMIEKLCVLVNTNGQHILDNPSKFRGLVLDHYGEINQRDLNVLVTALQQKTHQHLLSIDKKIPLDAQLKLIAHRLSKDTALTDDAAFMAVHALNSILRVNFSTPTQEPSDTNKNPAKHDMFMPYMKRITRVDPSVLLFLIDQSGSMKGKLGDDPTKRKCDAVAEAINHVIRGFIIQCAREEGVRDYFHIGVIGYADRAVPAFGGALKGLDIVPIRKVADNRLRLDEKTSINRIDDGAGGLIEQPIKHTFPVWFDPQCDGATVMCHAFDYAYNILARWIDNHKNSFPPIVINISDGEPTDGNPTKRAEKLKSLATTDGNVLLFNFHISSKSKGEILFPTEQEKLPDRHARLLFKLSSELTGKMVERAQHDNIKASDGSRGFGFCISNMEVLAKVLNIGSTTTKIQ